MRCSSNCISRCTFSCRLATESCVSGSARPRVAVSAGCPAAAPATPPHRFRRLLGRSSASLRRATLAEMAAAAAEAAATAALTDGAVVAADAVTTAAVLVFCLPTSTPWAVSACLMTFVREKGHGTWLAEVFRKRFFARSRGALLDLLLELMPGSREEAPVRFPHSAARNLPQPAGQQRRRGGRTAGAAGIQRNCLTCVGAKFRMADVASLLNGAWKRNLQCRRFGGGFDLLRASNSVVVIEDAPEAANQPGTRFINWKIGGTEGSASAWICMQCFEPDPTGCQVLQWTLDGHACHGLFKPQTAAMTLMIDLPSRTVTWTLRVLDRDTLAICVIEVDGERVPTVEYGHMCRIASAPELGGAAILTEDPEARGGAESSIAS